MKRMFTFLLVICALTGMAQFGPDWDITFGGSLDDRANAGIRSSDGSFLMAGVTESFGSGGSDMCLVKMNSAGGVVWSNHYGGNLNESANFLAQTYDGGYILTGYTASFVSGGNTTEIWVVKTDADGNQQWTNTYGEGIGKCIRQTLDGGFLIAGSRLIKTTSNGSVVWVNEINCYSAMETSDGGYIVLGGYLIENIMLIKLNSNGVEQWSKTFDGVNLAFPSTVLETQDNGFILCGTSSVASGSPLDAFLIKTDANGNLIWRETYGGVYHDEGHDVAQTTDGGYIMTGLTQEMNISDNDIWVVKVDAAGSQQWNWTLNSSASNMGESIQQLPDGGYMVAGSTIAKGSGADDMWLLHFPPEPLMAWFTAGERVVSSGENVQFYDGSTGLPDTYEWTFDLGNGNVITSNETDPQVTYNYPGVYDVTLTVSKGENSNDSFIRTDYIIVNNITTTSYCQSNGNATANWINSVAFNGQTNTSGSSGVQGYQDFTGVEFSFISGGSYPVTLEPGSGAGKKVAKWWRAWIDYDGNGDFTVDEIIFAADNNKSTVTGNVQIPAGLGIDTRMRISMSANGIPGPCGSFSSGEVEDYTVSIIPPIPQPPVADFTADNLNIYTGQTVTFSDLSMNYPDEWEWTFDIGEGTPVTSIAQDPSVVYPNPGVYTVTLTSSNYLGSDTKTKIGYIVVSIAPVPSYCTPEGISNLQDFIVSVNIGGLLSTTNQGTTGYMYYPSPEYTLIPGQSISLVLNPNNLSTRYYWRIWIDLNGDGDLTDTDELIFVANNKKGILSGFITIPSSASAGNSTRLRVSMKRGAAQADPCEGGFNGEVEDYNAYFDYTKSLPASSGDQNNELSIYPNPFDDNFNILVGNPGDEITIEVYNSLGQRVYMNNAPGNSQLIDSQGWESGIYLIVARNDKEYHIKKIMKKR